MLLFFAAKKKKSPKRRNRCRPALLLRVVGDVSEEGSESTPLVSDSRHPRGDGLVYRTSTVVVVGAEGH